MAHTALDAPHMPRADQRYLTWNDARDYYGLSLRTLRRRAETKDVIVVRMGGKPLIDRVATDAKLTQSAA